jgi:hypothetical protein
MRVVHCLILCGLVGLSGCGSSKTISRHDLATDAALAASLASESKLFIELRLQSRTTDNYNHEHADYLEDQASDLLKELTGKFPEGDAAAACQQLRSAVSELSLQLQTLHSNDPQILRGTAQHFAQQEKSLRALEASLR